MKIHAHICRVTTFAFLVAIMVGCGDDSAKINPQQKQLVKDSGQDDVSGDGGVGFEPTPDVTTAPPIDRSAADYIRDNDPTLWSRLSPAQKLSLENLSESALKSMDESQLALLLQVTPADAATGTPGTGTTADAGNGSGNLDLKTLAALIDQLLEGGVLDGYGDDDGYEDDYGDDYE